LRRGSAREEKEYELSHAYLAQEITHWIGRDALDNKRAQDLLQRELVNWRLFRILIDPEELNLLRNHLKYVSLDADAREMILYSCLEHGHDVGFWIEQMEDRNAAARQAASFAVTNEKITEQLKSGISNDLRPDILSVLWQMYNASGATQKREAAETLWVLRDWLSGQERTGLRWFLLPIRVWRSVQRNIWAWRVMGTAVVLSLIVFIFLVEHPVRSKWVPIPGGNFIMGMDRKEAEYASRFCLDGASKPEECDSIETVLAWSKRQPSATLKEYSILDNEVTFAQYQECVDNNACKTLSLTPEDQRRPNLPVTKVTWLQAEAYCEWLGGRLPTEAEWEKAARGPKGNYFPWGSDVEHWDPNLANIEHAGNTVKSIAQFAKTDVSVYGVKNMAGNAQEWTATEMPLEMMVRILSGLELDEQKFSNTPLSMAEAEERLPVVIVRGGSWNSARSLAFASTRRSRSIDEKMLEPLEQPLEQIGFRCACPVGVECRSPLEGFWTWLKAH
jgi:formylglycine-generating enzyme required for sulfatase activity